MNVSVRELKSGLSGYLQRVQRGEAIVVTSRGQPIASLVPLPSSVPVAERLQALPGIDVGSGEKPRGARHPVRIKGGQKSLSEIVLEGRR